eukprot:GHRR01028507.1.p1 GENE.GHRR01028507.1~~GHRR01028507.1.p1  ORF type:complete len:100 (-),score=18.07 GHRR01028507.1:247-546(-)
MLTTASCVFFLLPHVRAREAQTVTLTCFLFCLSAVLQANSILVAGHDTTSFMLTSTLYYVSKHPEVKAKVFAEIDRFGRDEKITSQDMDKFPYLDVSGS